MTNESILTKCVKTLEISAKLHERTEHNFDGIDKDFTDIAHILAQMTIHIKKQDKRILTLESYILR